MTRDTARHRSWKGRSIKIATAKPGDLEKMFREAVTRRAYRLFETHGCSPGHEGEDWKQAESDLVRPLACGLLKEDDKISLSADISVFEEESLEVCVELRRLSLCGRARTQNGEDGGCPLQQSVYRVLDLPVEVDPSQVHARFNGCILEIRLYRTPLSALAP